MITVVLFKIRISVSVGFFGVIAFLSYIDNTGMALYALLAAVTHEAGHIIFIYILKYRINEVVLTFTKAEIKGNFNFNKSDEVVIALAGSAFNFIVFIILTMLNYFFKFETFKLSSAMFAVGIFNLLPVIGLDGGTVLRCAFLGNVREKLANITCMAVSMIFCIIIFTLGFIAFKYNLNPSLLIMSLYLFMLTLKCRELS